MPGNHLETCRGCYEREMYVHQMADSDVCYCTRCGYEGVVKLAAPRKVAPIELSLRPRESKVRDLDKKSRRF